MKLSRLHSSCVLFWSGVPVMRSRSWKPYSASPFTSGHTKVHKQKYEEENEGKAGRGLAVGQQMHEHQEKKKKK